MAMKPRTGRSRVSKASEVVEKKAAEILPESSRSRAASQSDAASFERLAAGLAEEVVQKVRPQPDRPEPQSAKPQAQSSSRVRPQSKADEAAQRVRPQSSSPAPQTVKPEAQSSTRVRPQSKADEAAQRVRPQAARPDPQVVKPEAQASTRIRPQSKADEAAQRVPHMPASSPKPSEPQPARVTPQTPVNKPSARGKSGCCAIPFILTILSLIGMAMYIF